VWDLEHPERFYMIFTRPRWRSWLVRGAFIIGAYGVLLAVHLAAGASGAAGATRLLAWAGAPLAALTAVYTAYLFAQAKARDLWQNPLLPPHFLVQAVLAGAGTLLALSPWVGAAGPGLAGALRPVLAASVAAHLLLVTGEMTLTHATAHAHAAALEMTRGVWAAWFWSGVALSATAGAAAWGGAPGAAWIGPFAGAVALCGLFAHEHAYVQAGQSVPLA
ncbi:MAG: NrfD/PsrC family molybdoenzyme membrane anchor subunit, partial [Gemmatimonadota bacterium]